MCKFSKSNIIFLIIIIIIASLFSGGVFYFLQSLMFQKENIELDNEVKVLNDQLRIVRNDESKVITDQEKKYEYDYDYNNTYYSPEYNIVFRYNKDVPKTEFESIVYQENNEIKLLIPFSEENQKSINCGGYSGLKGCIELYGIKYQESYNKIVVFEDEFNNFEEAISRLLIKEGKNIYNCQLEIKENDNITFVTLKLADHLFPSEEEVNEWIEKNGDQSGAWLNEQLVQREKSEKYCSYFANTEDLKNNFFIFDKNKKKNYIYYTSNDMVDREFIDPLSIQFID